MSEFTSKTPNVKQESQSETTPTCEICASENFLQVNSPEHSPLYLCLDCARLFGFDVPSGEDAS